MRKIGFIDYYLDEFHANKYPAWIKEASNQTLKVEYAYAMIDSPNPGGMTTDEWCKANDIKRVYSIEELIEKSDCINVLSPDNPEMHEQLSELALKSGKRVYVDKTFAQTAASAKKLFNWANTSGTPCFSASALRFATEYSHIDPKTVTGIVSCGPGPVESYSIHQIEPIIAQMGADIQKVKNIGSEAHPAFRLVYPDGRQALLSHHGWDCPFTMTVDLTEGKTKHIVVESDFFANFIQAMVTFFRDGKTPVQANDTIAVIATREAMLKAIALPDQWVMV